ncbi:hypothetical protein AC578_10567 [Pseudocercospora eumusae]|uniref:Uncharacterized protein n=1 Tax=Pseudocercospora eumusae TaxID=321146 RepID=A0A139H5L3_9PEZI|nr:hypothetical protein AC578_10567 [Pseudocercospora eumusae]
MDTIRNLAGRENAWLSHLGKVMFVLFWCIDLPFAVDILGYIVGFSIITLSAIKFWKFRKQPAAHMAKHCQQHHLAIGFFVFLALTGSCIWLGLAHMLPNADTNASFVLPSSLRQLRKDSDTTIAFAETELAYLQGAAAASAYTCLVAACRVPGLPIHRTWERIQQRMQSASSPLGLDVSGLDARCWQTNNDSFMQSIVIADLKDETVANFRHDAIALGDVLSRYTCDTIDLGVAIDRTINSTIIGSMDEIQKLVNSTTSAESIFLDRLVAFYSSAAPTNFLTRRIYAKSLPIYTHLRAYFFPEPTATELLSSKLLSMITKVNSNPSIQVSLEIVRKTYAELSPSLDSIINTYSNEPKISPHILQRFPPMRHLLFHIRDRSTQALTTVLVSDDDGLTISASTTKKWWGDYLEEVIFRRIFVQVERIGKEVTKMREEGRWIGGSEWTRLLAGKSRLGVK